METGRWQFMSWETKEKLDSSLFLTGKPVLDDLEHPVNFEKMMKQNTVENITEWMFKSNRELKILDEFMVLGKLTEVPTQLDLSRSLRLLGVWQTAVAVGRTSKTLLFALVTRIIVGVVRHQTLPGFSINQMKI